MAADLKSQGTVVATANSVVASTNLVPPLPPDFDPGDLLKIITEARTRTNTCATPAGYTLIATGQSASTNGGRIYVFGKMAAYSGETAPTVAWTGLGTGTSGDSAMAIMEAWDGVDLTGGVAGCIDGTPVVADASSTTSIAIPSMTTTVDGSTQVAVVMRIDDTVRTFTPNAGGGWSEELDGGTTTGTGHSREVIQRVIATHGATATSTTVPSNTTAARTLVVTYALKATKPTLDFTDDFPGSSLGPKWETFGTTPTVSGGKAVVACDSGYAGMQLTTQGERRSLYFSRAILHMTQLPHTGPNIDGSEELWFGVRGNENGDKWLGVQCNNIVNNASDPTQNYLNMALQWNDTYGSSTFVVHSDVIAAGGISFRVSADATTIYFEYSLIGDSNDANWISLGTVNIASGPVWLPVAVTPQWGCGFWNNGNAGARQNLLVEAYNIYATAGDTTPPNVSTVTLTAAKISRVSGKDSTDFTMTADEAFVEYDLRIVSSGAAGRGTGTRIETNTVTSTTSYTATITDDELVAASAIEGTNIVKAFVKDAAGNWST